LKMAMNAMQHRAYFERYAPRGPGVKNPRTDGAHLSMRVEGCVTPMREASALMRRPRW